MTCIHASVEYMSTINERGRFKLTAEMKRLVLEASRAANDNGKMDIAKLCQDLGVEVFNFEFTDKRISGAIVKERDGDTEKWKIFVSTNDSPRRKRFTVAHEVGHYLSYVNGGYSKQYIDSNDGVLRDYSIMLRSDSDVQEQNKEAELEANEIAAELLMPESVVRLFYSQGKTVEEMADAFVVSESAMTIRLLNLGFKMMEQPLGQRDCDPADPVVG